jgi:voltage-gated potassium channel
MDEKRDQIKELALFRGCRWDQIDWICRTADALAVPAGVVLADAGSSVREFVVIVEGVAESMNEDGRVLLGPGAYYGELGLLDREPHGATITSRTSVHLLVFEARSFGALLDRIPNVARKLMRRLVADLRYADKSARSLRAVS